MPCSPLVDARPNKPSPTTSAGAIRPRLRNTRPRCSWPVKLKDQQSDPISRIVRALLQRPLQKVFNLQGQPGWPAIGLGRCPQDHNIEAAFARLPQSDSDVTDRRRKELTAAPVRKFDLESAACVGSVLIHANGRLRQLSASISTRFSVMHGRHRCVPPAQLLKQEAPEH